LHGPFTGGPTRHVVCYSEVEKQYTAACHNRYNHEQPHDVDPSVPESDLRPYIKHNLPIPVSCLICGTLDNYRTAELHEVTHELPRAA